MTVLATTAFHNPSEYCVTLQSTVLDLGDTNPPLSPSPPMDNGLAAHFFDSIQPATHLTS